jgi:hypothetical protein
VAPLISLPTYPRHRGRASSSSMMPRKTVHPAVPRGPQNHLEYRGTFGCQIEVSIRGNEAAGRLDIARCLVSLDRYISRYVDSGYRPAPSLSSALWCVSRKLILRRRLASHDPGAIPRQSLVSGGQAHQFSHVPRLVISMQVRAYPRHSQGVTQSLPTKSEMLTTANA